MSARGSTTGSVAIPRMLLHTKKRCEPGAISQQCAAVSSTARCSANRRCASGWSARCVRRDGQRVALGTAAIVMPSCGWECRSTRCRSCTGQRRWRRRSRKFARRRCPTEPRVVLGAQSQLDLRGHRRGAPCDRRWRRCLFCRHSRSDSAVHRVDRRRAGPRSRDAVRDSPAQRRGPRCRRRRSGRRVADRCGRRSRAIASAARL